jgi:hypothetical protein
MTRSMTRWMLAGFMALLALGAVLDVGSSTAEAAPSVSPFAGTYVSVDWPVPITISDGGRITSSFSGDQRSKGSISGRVSADGSFSYTVTYTYAYYDYLTHGRVPKEGWIWITESYETTGDMALDANGNIFATTDTGGSFVWLRQ